MYQSNIKVVTDSDYIFYANVNVQKIENICFGNVNVTLYSYVWHSTMGAKRLIHFDRGMIFIKTPPYKNYITEALTTVTKQALVWIFENWLFSKFYTKPALNFFYKFWLFV